MHDWNYLVTYLLCVSLMTPPPPPLHPLKSRISMASGPQPLLKCLYNNLNGNSFKFAWNNLPNSNFLNTKFHALGFKVPGSVSFGDCYFFLVGNMPLIFLTFLKLPLWSTRKKPECSIFLGLIVAARWSSRTPFSK